MVGRRRAPDARPLVMPKGRSIPRQPGSRPRRPEPPAEQAELDPRLRKIAGELTAGWANIHACHACERACDERAYGTGHVEAPIMLVKDRPSTEDLETTNAFTADAEALGKAFDALGIPLSWLYGSTAVRCGSAPATTEQIEACAGHLLAEIEAIAPKVIVAFGARAAEALIALDGRCGLSIPDDPPKGTLLRVRPGLDILITEQLPEGIQNKEAKRRLWRDLQAVPAVVGGS